MKCGVGEPHILQQKLEYEMTQILDDNMSLDEAVPVKSKFLTKEDVGQGIMVQIKYMAIEDVESDGVVEQVTTLHFEGDIKPFILKQTNKELLKLATGATTIAGIRGKQIVIINDPTVIFGGKLVGGLRIRSPQQQQYPPAAQQIPQAQPATRLGQTPEQMGQTPGAPSTDVPFDDDIPFG
jgi:hypothetical protein